MPEPGKATPPIGRASSIWSLRLKGAAAGGEKFPAVDHRCGQAAVVDHGSGARAPDGAGLGGKQLGGMVAEELEGVAALDQAQALVDQAFDLDRLDLGAVLLGLAATLRLLVDVERGMIR
jgi:hypothetical protein